MYHYLVMTLRTTQFQSAVIEPHNAFLDKLRQEGRLVLAGPFTDKSGGAYLVKAENMAEAESIAFSDPLHTSQSSKINVYEWNAK
jgi:uncharacterized protein YciI